MYFNKYPFSQNFNFSRRFDAASGFVFRDDARPVEIRRYGPNIFRLTVRGGDWDTNFSQAEYCLPGTDEAEAAYQLSVNAEGGVGLTTAEGKVLLEPFFKGSFGKCGAASMFRFRYDSENRFYGAGSKLKPLELTGVQSKFWSTDVWADFSWEQVARGCPDPYYVSIPYLIVKTANGWAGLLYNNPEAAFISVGVEKGVETHLKVKTDEARSVCIGSESGQPDLFVLAAGSLAELTRTFQQLVGVTPLPPLWALGYQQCRWGYESVDQLKELQTKFEEHEIPVDGLWLDIDYMDGFRVFTSDAAKIPDPSSEFQSMLESGHPVVPIIDPGVKYEPGYAVYDSGKAADVYCKNPEGEDFVGLVWPGMTVFPDFSREEGRAWWADQVEAFAKQGIVGAWLDMNDPSLGESNPYDMLFGESGAHPHRSFHNQYGMGMAKATRVGFERAHPDQRIFLLTRSNFTTGGKYAAVWTGDNLATYRHLRMSIPTSLNLALSGIPFNGADVGGFGYDAEPKLLRDWMKAACLGPFFRNHTVKGTVPQEPWAFDEITLAVCRDFIRLRYRLMPYLYNLFVQQAETGEAMMRPLIYDFDTTEALDLDRVDDAFMVGPSILQAPFVDEDVADRVVPLPGAQRWYAPFENKWHAGGQELRAVTREERSTPLFFREGAIIPLRRNSVEQHETDLRRVDLLIVADAETPGSMTFEYVADDGRSLGYQRGERSMIHLDAKVVGQALEVKVTEKASEFGAIDWRVLCVGDFDTVRIDGEACELSEERVEFAGSQLLVSRCV